MTQIAPRKSAMGVRHLPKIFRPSIKFAEQHSVTIADRDYGLMRVTAASGTPHPRIITGVNMLTLKERLEEVQETTRNAQRTDSDVDLIAGTTKHSRTSKSSDKNRSSVISDGHTVLQRISTMKRPIIRKMKDSHTVGGTKKCKKRVTLQMPKLTVDQKLPIKKPIEVLNSSTSSDNSNILSFNERRRIFHEGEFTIAKYGRKMSDHIMPITIKPMFIGESINTTDGGAERAKAEIEMYIRNQGYIMAPTGTLTNLRRFSSQVSKRSLPSNTDSVQSSSSLQSVTPKKKIIINANANPM